MQSNTTNAETATAQDGKLKKFKFYASGLRYYTMEAEGIDEDNALQLAYKKNQQWEEVPGEGDWQINNVEEVE